VLSGALIIIHEAPPPWSIHFRFLFRRGSKFSSSVEGPTQFLGGHGFALPVIHVRFLYVNNLTKMISVGNQSLSVRKTRPIVDAYRAKVPTFFTSRTRMHYTSTEHSTSVLQYQEFRSFTSMFRVRVEAPPCFVASPTCTVQLAGLLASTREPTAIERTKLR
jgi:hypothetical protein